MAPSLRPARPSEVKGIWFAALRQYLLDELGEERLQEIIGTMPAALRTALESPLVSSWYPEEALEQALAAVDVVAARGNDRQFVTMIEACTLHGISRFFRMLMQITTPQFALKQLPTLWRQVRRGAGAVTVEVERNVITIRYTDFPHFDDRRYRLLTEGVIRGILTASTKRRALAKIEDYGTDWLTMRVVIPDAVDAETGTQE